MTWADIFTALEMLLVFPALSAAFAIAWKAANSAGTMGHGLSDPERSMVP